ncbi:Hypothetical_protein [Hexamita inflata]|uniref:Hypothetical_protein n=1 Tax=Hexamita inflata TaxID=28002 RepID=A0ABP1GKN0_9EUKA
MTNMEKKEESFTSCFTRLSFCWVSTPLWFAWILGVIGIVSFCTGDSWLEKSWRPSLLFWSLQQWLRTWLQDLFGMRPAIFLKSVPCWAKSLSKSLCSSFVHLQISLEGMFVWAWGEFRLQVIYYEYMLFGVQLQIRLKPNSVLHKSEAGVNTGMTYI